MINPFKKKYSHEELETFNFLSSIELFDKLNDEDLQLLIPIMYLRKYNQNEVVFFSGDPSHALYLVKKGQVSLTIDIKDQFEELMTVNSLDAFGDNALIEDSKRIYNSVVTSETAELYVLPHISLMEILNNHPNVKSKIMTAMVKIYNTYTAQLFKVYKSSFGFFELHKVYRSKK